jgi:acyl-CoA oxidase
MHQLSHAQSYVILVTNFYKGFFTMPFDELTKSVFRDLFRLFAYYTISNSAFDFLSSGALVQSQLSALPGKILSLMRAIRPHAVRLVDAWAIPDYLLDSSLGRYDGKVYGDMFHKVHRLNPLNKITFNPDYRNPEIVMGADDGEKILAKL